MDFALTTDQGLMAAMTFDKAVDGNLLNNIYLSLEIAVGSFFQNPAFGSRLHLLAREKNTARMEILAVEYCKEALAWLIDAGRVTKFDFETQRDKLEDRNRMKILIQATKANGDVVPFTKFVEVV